jgi:hypothetical protein
MFLFSFPLSRPFFFSFLVFFCFFFFCSLLHHFPLDPSLALHRVLSCSPPLSPHSLFIAFCLSLSLSLFFLLLLPPSPVFFGVALFEFSNQLAGAKSMLIASFQTNKRSNAWTRPEQIAIGGTNVAGAVAAGKKRRLQALLQSIVPPLRVLALRLRTTEQSPRNRDGAAVGRD